MFGPVLLEKCCTAAMTYIYSYATRHHTVKTKLCYPYFFGMVFLLTPYIPFFGMLCILPVCNPHPKRYEMHTLNIFQNKEIHLNLNSQVATVTSSATLSSTLFTSFFELAASIFAVKPIYIPEMGVVHKTTMYTPISTSVSILTC